MRAHTGAQWRQGAGPLSKLLFTWLLPLFWRGLRRDLDKRDLGAPLPCDLSAPLTDKLEINWLHEVESSQRLKRKPKLLRAIAKTFICQYLLDGLLVLIQYVGCKSFQPLLLAQLLGHLGNSTAWANGGRSAAFQCAAGMIGLSLASVFIQHHTTLRQQQLGMRVRIACCSLLYRKILRLSSHALSQTTAGQLVNLMSNDVNRFDSVLKFLHVIWVVPIQIALCCYLYSQRVSSVALLGVACIILQTLPVQSYISRISSRLRLKIAKKTDERVRLMDEIICGIQVIKMYAWEGPFSATLGAARKAEADHITQASRLRAVNASFLIFAERTSLYVTLLGHVLLGMPVDAATVYSLAQLYNMLQTMLAYVYPNALTASAECLVSVKRIQTLLLLDEQFLPALPPAVPLSPGIDNLSFDPQEGKMPPPTWVGGRGTAPPSPAGLAIEMKGAAASWAAPGAPDTLRGLDLRLRNGTLCLVIGSVGAGKSSLLQLVLKELPCKRGSMSVSGSVSYASQEPWLFVATIRNNILFGQSYEPKKYREVVRVCALEKDFTQFPRGDQTLVGERGVSLSGGQRARINLARAVYRDADIYLLDDPLAGVDAPVSNQLFHACIADYLCTKTRILVTHQQQYLKAADLIVIMDNGQIVSSGTYDQLAQSGKDPAMLLSVPALDRGLHDEHEHPFTPTASIREISRRISIASTVKSEYDDDDVVAQEEEAEMSATGRMKASVFWRYWKAGGSRWLLGIVACVMLLSQLSASGADYWVTYWTNHRSQELIQVRQLEDLYLTAADGNLETTYGILNYELNNSGGQAEFLKGSKPHNFTGKPHKNLTDLLLMSYQNNSTRLNSSDLAELDKKNIVFTSRSPEHTMNLKSGHSSDEAIKHAIQHLKSLPNDTHYLEDVNNDSKHHHHHHRGHQNNSDSVQNFDNYNNNITHANLADLLLLTFRNTNGAFHYDNMNASSSDLDGKSNESNDTLKNDAFKHNMTLLREKARDLLGGFTKVLSSLSTMEYLYVHTVLIVLCIVLTISGSILFFTACMRSSQGLHDQVFNNVLRTNMKFFDTNPSGRILNRFSKDMGAIDELLPKDMMEALQIMLFMISALIMVSVTSRWLLLPAGALLLLFWGLLSCYLATAQDIKRLEGITRSPVFSHTCASIKGISTIRSSKAQLQLANEFDSHQDLHTAAWYLFLSSRSTLGFWLDIICVSFVTCVAFTFIFFNDGSTLPGDAGLAISQSLILTSMLQFGVRQATEVVSHLTSVERVLQYSELPQENSLHKGDKPTPKNWPSEGSITFTHVFLSYSDTERPVLQDLSIHIKSGWKVGIVGRTGAGKSSLIAALFRLATVEGSITIDGVEMGSIALQDLRSKISIIPQEPILFSASMRHNLDPFEEFDDATLWSALETVDLKESVLSLEQRVSEGGANFSLGQRQLVCLARAILRNNKILVLDEATANMDPQTDQFIQRIIRERFASCTVLTIAHRLGAVLTADRVLVLEGGRAAQFGRPRTLLRDTKGAFARLAQGHVAAHPGTPSYGSMSDEADS